MFNSPLRCCRMARTLPLWHGQCRPDSYRRCWRAQCDRSAFVDYNGQANLDSVNSVTYAPVPSRGHSGFIRGCVQFTTNHHNWSAAQTLGAPNTNSYGDLSTAWSPLAQNGTTEFYHGGVCHPGSGNRHHRARNLWQWFRHQTRVAGRRRPVPHDLGPVPIPVP